MLQNCFTRVFRNRTTVSRHQHQAPASSSVTSIDRAIYTTEHACAHADRLCCQYAPTGQHHVPVNAAKSCGQHEWPWWRASQAWIARTGVCGVCGHVEWQALRYSGLQWLQRLLQAERAQEAYLQVRPYAVSVINVFRRQA